MSDTKNQLTYQDIKVEIPYKIKTITKIAVEKKINEHGKAEIQGILEEDVQDDLIMNASLKDKVEIKCKAKKEQTIFTGVVIDIKLKHVNKVKYIKIKALSHSFLMDIKKKSRSFQNKDNTYENIFKKIIREEYKGDYIDTLTKKASQGASIIQYQETDWEFIKRLASHFNGVIVPETTGDTPKIWIGIPNGESYKEEELYYTIEKDIKTFGIIDQNVGKQSHLNHIIYEVESKNLYNIGDKVTYKEVPFIVKEIKFNFEKDLVYLNYKFQKPEGIKVRKIYNEKIRGASLDGKILKVEKDTIKLHLNIDKEQTEKEAYPYKYNTPYTSEGTTGWYVMPKEGDSAKLYIPEADETKAYVRVINRTDGKSNPLTKDPSTKYLGTINHKQIKMSKSELKITAKEEKKGKMHISMEEEKGISLESDKKIEIISESDITITGNKINVSDKEEIRKEAFLSTARLYGKTEFKSSKITMKGRI
ncbi:contractile injection system protein, VgrG/Pvc8 family [Defluviitalea phaphyphila]|uniref:contractile injection system protein, VgrG/Pvc8 family n=1 Tax=Defluviitalea phaphyphila TaxID=1473580 RepID=UPI0007314BC4|nr:contractile injection system protein, VgrG/Pvc8 family [Defluviitalea phaphyphila]